jgi:hypothetical protein
VKGTSRTIEPPLAFCPALNPTEPIDISAIGEDSAVPKSAPIVIIPIELSSETELPQIVKTERLTSLLASLTQGWEQKRAEHRDDRNDHQELDQSEG